MLPSENDRQSIIDNQHIYYRNKEWIEMKSKNDILINRERRVSVIDTVMEKGICMCHTRIR